MKPPAHSPPAPDRLGLERQVKSLRRDIRQLQLEHDLLKKANELLKNLGVDLQLLSKRKKTLLIDALKETYLLPELLAELGLAHSSYFYHRAQLLGADKYAEARLAITDIFERNHSCCGYRQLRVSPGSTSPPWRKLFSV
jgi:putative transposase